MNRNDLFIKRLHEVRRPLIRRRLRTDVEKQMAKKDEDAITSQLSKQQQQLYEDFLPSQSTRHVIRTGEDISVINIFI